MGDHVRFNMSLSVENSNKAGNVTNLRDKTLRPNSEVCLCLWIDQEENLHFK